MNTQGGGQFRQQLIGGDFSVTIVYPELKEKFVKLFGELPKACESAPVDKNYKWVSSDAPYTQTLVSFIQEHERRCSSNSYIGYWVISKYLFFMHNFNL